MQAYGDIYTISERFRSARKKAVKRWGRRLLRELADFIANQSLIGNQPVFDKAVFPWISDIESRWESIRDEMQGVLDARSVLPAFHQISPDQKRISRGDNWKVFAFYVFGDRFDPNCRRCPRTAAALQGVPGLRNAWFSILAPHYRIPPHQGPTKGVVRIHLGLKIPADAANCWIRVEDRILHWKEGECIVFDDHYEHEVHNDTGEQRVVLFFDVDRPMRPAGRLLNLVLIAAMKRSAYVRDAVRNLEQWDAGL